MIPTTPLDSPHCHMQPMQPMQPAPLEDEPPEVLTAKQQQQQLEAEEKKKASQKECGLIENWLNERVRTIHIVSKLVEWFWLGFSEWCWLAASGAWDE